ncbi:MAG: thioredoxin domain-containing protein [Candidatus Planktophila sp.]|jgi:protein-disulfide isomerase|tara:strand:- start:7557 stop:8237 length:681 start_codon:yes stop_codon:yes gene_type:complete
MAQAKKPTGGKDNFTRNLVIAVVLGVVLIMLVPTLLSKSSDTNAAIPSSVSVEDGYGIVFNKDVPDVPFIEIYEDFQCPACQGFEGINGGYIEDLISEKKAKVAFHMLSFLGPDSQRAANAAACSADQGKFLQFHKTLYANQPTENSGAWSTEYLATLGLGLGIADETYSNCVTNNDYAGWVGNVAAEGAKRNINSTPTVLINGVEIDRNTAYGSLAAFKAAVEKG